jgi:type VI secretion system protein ImpA
MASPSTLDIEQLLAPIEGDNPAGVDIREDVSPTSDYYKVKDARSAARAAERNLEADDEPSGALPEEWRTILQTAPDLIQSKSKDLELASWLIEALLRAHGFAGLRDGFRLAAGMVENFWDNLYPLEDEDGVETKVAPISGLNGEGADGTLIQPIRKVLITDGSSFGPFAAWHYDQALEVAKITDDAKRQQRIDAGNVSMGDFEKSVAETPGSYYVTLIADLEECLEAFDTLCGQLDEKCGSDSPPASNIRNALRTVLDTVKFVSRDLIAVDAPEEAVEGEGAPAAGNGAAAPAAAGGAAGPIASREDAFRQLTKVADYFRRTEPHSPISYTLDDLVRRGRLSLPELLAELIKDQSTRNDFLARAGIQPSEDQ